MNLKKLFKIILISIPIIMVGWHFYASNFNHLTKWKGSGYAMYTNSHPDYRSIVFKPFQSDSLIQVYPITDEDYYCLKISEMHLYRDSYKILKLAAFYPERYQEELKSNKWMQRFLIQPGTIELHRTDLDIDNKEVTSIKMYTYE